MDSYKREKIDCLIEVLSEILRYSDSREADCDWFAKTRVYLDYISG